MPTITIDMDKKCKRCGKGGAMENGVCMLCFSKYYLPKFLKKLKAQSNKPIQPTSKMGG